MAEFIHLHLHTEYSLLDGACRVDELLEQAARRKIPAMAVTEHGNMFSSVVFHDKARKKGVKPILGCETYVATGSRFTKGGGIGETYNHLVLLAENREGYQNLIKLVSAGYTEGFHYRPRIDKELLAQHSRGLIGLSSCLKGEIPAHLLRRAGAAGHRGGRLLPRHLGPGNFFLEMQYQGIEDQRVVNAGLQRVAKALDLPLVCTNDVHYLHREDFKAHDILLCIGTGKTVNDAERMRYLGDQFYLKTPEEMARGVRRLPGGDGEHRPHRRSVQRRPRQDRPPAARLRGARRLRARRVFRADGVGRVRAPAAAARVARRPPGSCGTRSRSTSERVAYEIAMIKQMKYAGYFLIVWDFIRYAREQRHPGRPGPRVGGRQRRRLLR